MLAETTEMLQLLLDVISKEAQTLRLSINPDKTKSLAEVKSDKNISKTNITLKIGNDPIRQVEDFVYLVCLQQQVRCRERNRRHVGLAAANFARFNKIHWFNKNIKRNTKLKVYKMAVLPSLLYGSETWVL